MDDEKVNGGFHSALGETAPTEAIAGAGDSPELEDTETKPSIEATSPALVRPSFDRAPIPSPPSRAPATFVPPPFAPSTRTNPFAIVSFVLAFFVTILSIVFGHVALSQIKRTGEKGRGFALAGLWISYLSVTAAVVAIATLWLMALNAENAVKSQMSSAYSGGVVTYSPPAYSYNSTPQPYAPAAGDGALPAGGSSLYSYPTQPAWSPAADGPAGVSLPSTSTPQSNADRAYCHNQGVLLWLAKSTAYRGALCSINGSLTLISMASDVGGNVTLPAQDDSTSFSATGTDGTLYRYTKDSVSITTPSKTFTEPTTLWEPGTSSDLSSPGDLGISTPISYPSCDGSAMIVYGTSWNNSTNADQVKQLLSAHPGSSYMRTDLSCRDFTGPSAANSGGAYVYAVYSISSRDAACQAIAGTSNYGRILSNSNDPGDNIVKCS